MEYCAETNMHCVMKNKRVSFFIVTFVGIVFNSPIIEPKKRDSFSRIPLIY